MFEFIKKIINKIFGKKQELLSDKRNEGKQMSNSMDEVDEIDNVFEYLTNVKMSCDNYEEYNNTMKEYDDVKAKMFELKENINNNSTNL